MDKEQFTEVLGLAESYTTSAEKVIAKGKLLQTGKHKNTKGKVFYFGGADYLTSVNKEYEELQAKVPNIKLKDDGQALELKMHPLDEIIKEEANL